MVDLSAYGFTTAADAKAFAAHVSDDVVFTFSAGNVLTIENLTMAQLADADFILLSTGSCRSKPPTGAATSSTSAASSWRHGRHILS